MRILILHSRYLSGETSGENRVVESESGLLRDSGHDVRVWSPSPEDVEGLRLLRTGARAIWSASAVEHVRRLIREQDSDVVHFHNLFPMLSPAVVRAANAEGAAVVMTLHNYRMMCLPATFLREGKICEACLGRPLWRGVVYRCYRGSFLGSGVLAGSMSLHRRLGSFDRVHRFLAVSRFLRDKYVQAGVSAERIAVKPNFVPAALRRSGPGGYLLFLGRLSPEKGLATLFKAHKPEHPRLVVAGTGPQEPLVEARVSANVEFRGALAASDVQELIAGARALVMPSTWYEGAPRSLLEAYAAGVPVIGSRIGALNELIEDDYSGLLVRHDDVDAWSTALERLGDDDESERLGAGAASLWARHYTPDAALRNLLAAYIDARERVGEVETSNPGPSITPTRTPTTETAAHGTVVRAYPGELDHRDASIVRGTRPMRILVLHTRYLSGVISGENRVVDDEVRLLREAGHDVETWTPSVRADALAYAHAGFEAVWSAAAVRETRRLVRATRAEIVHCHNLFPVLSPAVLRAASSEGAAVVMTLHNYRLMCLPATLLRHGKPCEDCVGRAPWRGVVHRCYRGSTLGSGAIAASLGAHRTLGTFGSVQLYLAVSQFLRAKHVQAGFAPEAIDVKPNFAWPGRERVGPGRYFLYLGRLSHEKGLGTLLEAWSGVDARLVLAGDGPAAADLRRCAGSNVEFRGTVGAKKAAQLLSGARAVVMPSLSYEGAPRVVLEAFAAGVPVVASRIGALPELIDDESTGYLIPPRASAAWAAAIDALRDDAVAEQMGNAAYRTWEKLYTPSQGLANLERVYERALQVNAASRPR